MNSRIEQLLQLVKVTWDGDLISKQARDALDKECLVTKVRGYTLLTDEGVRVLVQLGLLKEETPVAAAQGEGQSTAANTGSLKLPSLKDLESAYEQQSIKDTNHRATEDELVIVRFCHDYMVGQLQASA